MDRYTKYSAIFVFFTTLAVYLRTMAPTASFWDCGEFIACSKILAVPHPPGAPLFILIGRVMSLIPYFDTGFLVNLISVITSTFTVLILFLVIVRLIKEWRGEVKTTEDRIILNASGIIGALSFAFTDTFWFNAVEAEVYAMSMFFAALVLWLILKWMDAFENYRSLKYLVLIFYMFGLSLGVHLQAILVVPTILMLIWFTDRKLLFRFDLGIFLVTLLAVGYTIYILIYIRAGLNPPINENDPSTWAAFKSYLNREQYGQESMVLGIFDRKAPIWEYQIKKMFLRYFAWNFYGKGTTYGADGYIVEIWSPRGLYGLPLLLGCYGLFYHLKRDWKRWLAIFALFIVSGLLLNIYLNQPDPQPRERDYVYVGSFFAFSIWIGIGVTGFLETIYRWLARRPEIKNIAAGGIIACSVLIAPINLVNFNFNSHDRSGNYVAWDHSYNLLMSCEPNAILITNGDNDTFPLWYLQEVEGIRKDVRVANLSLLNTNWYIYQLKHDEPKVPISLSDEQIHKQSIVMWEKTRQVSVPVPPDKFRSYMKEMEGAYDFPDTTIYLRFDVAPTIQGRAIRIQDYLILNIIFANKWTKPIYFAITVEGKNFIGLQKYFRLDGMAYKLTPIEGQRLHPPIIEDNILNKYNYRNLDNPDVYYNENIISLLQNYRNGFMQLAVRLYNDGEKERAVALLDSMEKHMPYSVLPIPNPRVVEEIGRLYHFSGRSDELEKRLDYLVKLIGVPEDNLYNYAAMYDQLLQKYDKAVNILEQLVITNPNDGKYIGLLSSTYEKQKKYQQVIYILKRWLETHPDDKGAKSKIEDLEARLSQPQTPDSSMIQVNPEGN